MPVTITSSSHCATLNRHKTLLSDYLLSPMWSRIHLFLQASRDAFLARTLRLCHHAGVCGVSLPRCAHGLLQVSSSYSIIFQQWRRALLPISCVMVPMTSWGVFSGCNHRIVVSSSYTSITNTCLVSVPPVIDIVRQLTYGLRFRFTILPFLSLLLDRP